MPAALRLGAPSVSANRLVFSSTGVGEWFANGPWGLEQGFTLTDRPAGSGPLLISQAISGNATGLVNGGGQAVTFSSHAGSLRYRDLLVTDATGMPVPARLSVTGHRLTITITDARATYPLRVDPTMQQTAKLTASDGAANNQLGYSVAVSSDGSTVVAGAPFATVGINDEQGKVYVFVKASGGWSSGTSTAKLTASDGISEGQLGSSVAVSSNGSTVVAGAPHSEAAYVFVKPSGGWSSGTETAKLTASDGAGGDDLGASVGVSADGSTVVAGAPYAAGGGFQLGAAYVFVKPSGGWSSGTQTAKLTAPPGGVRYYLGTSVAVSADASTVVAGAPGWPAVFVFVKPAGGWSSGASTAELTESDWAGGNDLGSSVGVSADGSTVVAGDNVAADGSTVYHGAVYVFVKPSGGWSSETETAKLTASDGVGGDQLGFSVGVSSDGSTVVAGALDATVGGNIEQGAVYVFVKPSGGWSSGTQTAKLTASDGAANDQLGASVGVSADGSTVVAGADNATVGGNGYQGAAYAFGLSGSSSSSLSVSLAGSGSGSVTGSGISCPGSCSGSYASGTTVTLTATPATGSAFTGWSGGGCTGTGTCAVTLSSDQDVTATFTASSSSGSGGGGSSTGATASAGSPSASGTTASTPLTCTGPSGTSCTITITLTVTETLKSGKVVAVSAKAKAKPKTTKRTVTVGSASVTLDAGQNQTVSVSLNGTGKALLKSHHKLAVMLTANAGTSKLCCQNVTFKEPTKKKTART
jgi:co-chaperonin GroES (HSP10)